MKKNFRKIIALFVCAAVLITAVPVSAAYIFTDADGVKHDYTYSYKQIQNGGFDLPPESGDTGHYASTTWSRPTYTYAQQSTVPYWYTSASDNVIELFKSGSPHFNVTKNTIKNYAALGYNKVAEGTYACELNANQESSIYQRVNTVAGSTYTWGLSHRGREATDSMVLIIGPEQFDSNGNKINIKKTNKTTDDQFVRLTKWLKKQYGIEYPETGCSKKYTVYTKPFASSAKFVNDSSNEDENISLKKTGEINQEWSVWIISSKYCNTDADTVTEDGITIKNATNGWSNYGSNACSEYADIIQGANSSLGYDCTYTVPNGQTHTLFAFCSLSSYRLPTTQTENPDITFGNMLDGMDFKLYQHVTTTSTVGGIGAIDKEQVDDEGDLSKVTIKTDITSSNSCYTTVLDGQYCDVYTTVYNEDKLKDCELAGAYVTVNNDDGTSVTRFVTPYTGDTTGMTDEELDELAKSYFVYKDVTLDTDSTRQWQYYFRISATSPTVISLVYSKAPFLLYDSNGGQEYYFSPDNTQGGNLVGFADHFQTVFDREEDGVKYYEDTSAYYKDATITYDGESPTTVPGYYYSHSALPNENWETFEDGTSASRFCGWRVRGSDGTQYVLDGNHTVSFDPNDTDEQGSTGIVRISDSNVTNLALNVSHGVTLVAMWEVITRAQALTYNNVTREYENSAVGGTVTETVVSENSPSDVTYTTQEVNGETRNKSAEVATVSGELLIFKAEADYENGYEFLGWYYKEKQEDGTYVEKLKSTSTTISVNSEQGTAATYYAKFAAEKIPVVFYYSATGSSSDYAYYEASSSNRTGAYFQQLESGQCATKPTGDASSVKTWFTSPTIHDADHIFDFENTPITSTTKLYATPSFTFNYYNSFQFAEPWTLKTYATLKLNGKYVDMQNDADMTAYNIYVLQSNTVGEATPSAQYIKNNATTKVSKGSSDIIYNQKTGTGKTFSRAGIEYNNLYIYNMKSPVWVLFDFTYKGIR